MLTIATVLAAQLAAGTLQLGIADVRRDGRSCVALPGSRLSAGDPVTLVRVDTPQSAIVVVVERTIETCEPLTRAMADGPFYLATRPPNGNADGGIWIAISGRRVVRQRAGVVTIDLGSASRSARVRSCTSSEGLHLTLWAGAPLKSRRLWHAYYYLGYDVEPSCDERDYQP